MKSIISQNDLTYGRRLAASYTVVGQTCMCWNEKLRELDVKDIQTRSVLYDTTLSHPLHNPSKRR